MPFTEYFYNGKRFVHVGPDFPPKNNVSKFPIVCATCGSRNVTQEVKTFAGPLSCDTPSPGYILYKSRLGMSVKFWGMGGICVSIFNHREKGSDEVIHVQRLFGHCSDLGAK